MKKSFLIAIVVIMVAIMGVVGLAACNNADYTVGVIQLAPHVALDKAYEGFKSELTTLIEQTGKTIKFDFNNAQGDENNNSTIVGKLVGKKVDLIYSIATSSSLAAVQGTVDNQIPVLFNAVTDPVQSGLVASWEASEDNKNVSGVSDKNPIEDQVELMAELMGNKPDLKIGVLYTSAEENSIVQRDQVKAICEQKGYAFADRGIQTVDNIGDGLNYLKGAGVDIVYLPTDNLLANNASAVHAANLKGINLPIVCGESGMNEQCGVATIAVDYEYLGKLAGQMAFEILVNGKKPSELPIATQTENLVTSVNQTVADDIGFPIPDSVKVRVSA